MPGGVCGGAVCAISHNLQSNASRCSGRPMTSTPSNHKRLNLNGRYELRWRNLSPTLEARNSAGHTINGDWQMAARSCTCHTIWTETGSWQRTVQPPSAAVRLQRRAPSSTGVRGGARKRVTTCALARQLASRRAFALLVFCNYFSWFCVPNHSVG